MLKNMNVLIPDECKKYMELQCNSVLDDYRNCPELDPILGFLEQLNPKRVLELGAGLGRVSVFIKNCFDWRSTEFYLLDGDSGEEQIAGIHWDTKPAFYNSLASTEEFCTHNNIKEEKLFLLNAEKRWAVDKKIKFDLCYSFKAIGFHWPINEYLDIIKDNLERKAYLLFEIRNEERSLYNTDKIWKRRCDFVKHQLDYVAKFNDYVLVQKIDNTRYPLILLQRV